MAGPSIARLRPERPSANVVVMHDTPRSTTPSPRLSAHWRIDADRRLILTWTVIVIRPSKEPQLADAA
jgi:hypothetical protein